MFADQWVGRSVTHPAFCFGGKGASAPTELLGDLFICNSGMECFIFINRLLGQIL